VTKSFVADPSNDKARKLVGVVSYGNWISVVIAFMAAILASLATLSDVSTVRWLTEYSDPNFLDSIRVIQAGVGAFLLWQVVFRLLPVVLFRKYLREGTILKLDDSIASLDLSKCEEPAAVRFSLQRDRNADLRRYVDRSCLQQ